MASEDYEKQLSFCITSLKRTDQIKITLPKNLEDNRKDSAIIEFVLIDFNRDDELHNYIMEQFEPDLKSGYLKYFHTRELLYWNAAIAKNTSHYYATGRVLVNLDGDNFTGVGGGLYVLDYFNKNPNMYLHQYSNIYHDGTFGRLAYTRDIFFKIGGHDESLVTSEDDYIIAFFDKLGLACIRDPNPIYTSAISNPKSETYVNCDKSIVDSNQMADPQKYDEFRTKMMNKMYARMYENFRRVQSDRSDKLDIKFGIRQNVYSYQNSQMRKIN